MEVRQVYELVNNATSEILGDSVVLAEDLTNLIDVGTEIFNANAIDNYVRSLVNHIGRVIFVNRPYTGAVPSIIMDGWEYGSVLEKITAEMPIATENETWELEDGQTYEQDIFYKPVVTAKFFNSKVTFEVPMSFTERQIRESFSSARQMNGFTSMLYNAIDRSMTVKIDSLTMRTINNMIAETIYSEYTTAQYSASSGVRAVNILKLYNDKFNSGESDTPLTVDLALNTPDFIRFASYIMGLYVSRLSRISTMFNIGGKDRFTSKDKLHFVLLADFEKAANVYLYSDVYHNELTKIPKAETVPFWQGSGTSYAFSDITKINVTTAENHAVNVTGVLGVMFDRDAMGITNVDRRVTTHYNAKAEFYNNWFKYDAGYFNDFNENCVVFFIA